MIDLISDLFNLGMLFLDFRMYVLYVLFFGLGDYFVFYKYKVNILKNWKIWNVIFNINLSFIIKRYLLE